MRACISLPESMHVLRIALRASTHLRQPLGASTCDGQLQFEHEWIRRPHTSHNNPDLLDFLPMTASRLSRSAVVREVLLENSRKRAAGATTPRSRLFPNMRNWQAATAIAY